MSFSLPEDGWTHSAIVDFASLGCGGQHPQNIERDLHTWVRSLLGWQLEYYNLKLDLMVADSETRVSIDVPCLLPHEVLHALWLGGWQQFQISTMGPGGPDELTKYWEWAQKRKLFNRHPALAGRTPA